MSIPVILAIDEGTTNAKAILMNRRGEVVAEGSCAVPIERTRSGVVQQDADDIWAATVDAMGICLHDKADVGIEAVGISNQRESVLIWDRASGRPLGPVISWQCRRTAERCRQLKADGHEEPVRSLTGLPLDPMFPATKIAWLLGHYGSAQADICVGTIDGWLIWKLSNGAVHATDRSNAARTQLYNIAECRWDDGLCSLFGVPRSMLPAVRDSSCVFGVTKNVDHLTDGIPIASALGDSHAALFRHGAFYHHDGKATFGTGSSVMKTIPRFMAPPAGITTTIAWSVNEEPAYAFEGNILSSAAVLPWTVEMLGLKDVDALLGLAKTVPDSAGVSLVPAHVGLGAPHWLPDARGVISGLSFGTRPAHIARAAAESMALQVMDVFDIMSKAGGGLGRLFVDGGPSRNAFLMQMVADFLQYPVVPGHSSRSSAAGAAHLAGLAIGFWSDAAEVAGLAKHDPAIAPSMAACVRSMTVDAWKNAIARSALDV